MNQQINLYEEAPEISVWKTYSPFPQIALGVVVLLGLIYFAALWQHWKLEDEYAALQLKAEAETTRLDEIRASMPTPGIDPELEKEIADLMATERGKKMLLQALDQDRVGNDTGFSSHMEGLARRHVKGLWLTKIDLTDGGANLSLEGLTGKPEYVPQLFQSLSRESVFQGTEFDIFSLSKTEEAKSPMTFSVRAEVGSVADGGLN